MYPFPMTPFEQALSQIPNLFFMTGSRGRSLFAYVWSPEFEGKGSLEVSVEILRTLEVSGFNTYDVLWIRPLTPEKEMHGVFFESIPLDTIFVWKGKRYKKTEEEKALCLEDNKSWGFERHYGAWVGSVVHRAGLFPEEVSRIPGDVWPKKSPQDDSVRV